MPYITPRYGSVPKAQFRIAMRDIVKFNNISDAIEKTVGNLSDDLSKIAYDVMNEVMLESKLEYVPVYTGRLRSSGYVEIPQLTENGVSVTAGYHAPYAFFVHEYHKTKSNYLSIPFQQALDSGIIEERISRKILQSMGF